MLKFRTLTAQEIDVRVATVSEKGCSVLLYKDARCDMNILDETVGPMDWKREHTRDNANCIVSIWDDKKGQWISKEDTGTESFTEKEKGLASDSFKRACFNWGIGRELYTAPFIWINANNVELKDKGGKKTTYDRFTVDLIEYDDNKNITKLVIRNENKNAIAYEFGVKRSGRKKAEAASTAPTQPEVSEKEVKVQSLVDLAASKGITLVQVKKVVKTEYDCDLLDMNEQQYTAIFNRISKK